MAKLHYSTRDGLIYWGAILLPFLFKNTYMKKLHVIFVEMTPLAHDGRRKITITSNLYQQTVYHWVKPAKDKNNEIQLVLEAAIDWAKTFGVNIIGIEEGEEYIYLVSDTIKALDYDYNIND